MARGKFITFEGGEGSGKSTQARLLADRLEAEGLGVLLTREPGGSPFAEKVRELLLNSETPPHSALSEALLFYAARADHLEKAIRPALASGTWVVCDRFSDSTRVYQGTAGHLAASAIDQLERLAVAPTHPDLTVIVDLDPAIGLSRAAARRSATKGGATRGADRYESRTLAYHQALRDGFLAIARAEPGRCVVIDGASEPDAVAREIWAAVQSLLLSKVR